MKYGPMEPFTLIIKNDEGEYLEACHDGPTIWGEKDSAAEFETKEAFDLAGDRQAHVYLRLHSGREIQVSCKDVFI